MPVFSTWETGSEMIAGLALSGIAVPARVIVNRPHPVGVRTDVGVPGQQPVEPSDQPFLVLRKCWRCRLLHGGSLHRRSAPVLSLIHFAEARDLASVAAWVMYEGIASLSSSSGVASSLHGASRLAAAFA